MARNASYPGARNKVLDIYSGLKNKNFAIGSVKNVNIDEGKIDVYIANKTDLKGVWINFGGNSGIYHGIRAMPKQGDIVLIAFGSDGTSWHIGTFPLKYAQLIQEVGSTNTSRLEMKKLKEGEIELASCTVDGLPSASITLLNDGRINLTAGSNVFALDPDSGLFIEQNLITMRGGNTRIKHGWVERLNTEGNLEPKITGGAPYTGVGEPLQEVYIAINQPTNSSDQDIGDPDIKIQVSDEILDDLSIPELEDGKKLNALIDFKSNVRITIDTEGTVKIKQSVGSYVTMKANGDIEIVSKGDMFLETDVDCNIKTQGDVYVESQGETKVNATGDVSVISNTGKVTLDAATTIELGNNVVKQLCNNLPNCLFTGAPHAVGNIQVKV